MPWKETRVMDERMRFIVAFESERWSMTALCERFEISRKTGYKWIKRYEEEGVIGLQDRSRAPHHHANAVSQAVRDELLRLKKVEFKSWGPEKIRDWLIMNRPDQRWPATSTIAELYDRHGLVKRRTRRCRAEPSSEPLSHCEAPNDVWSVDFKGQFRMGDGAWCFPLTATDNKVRYLLLCQSLPSIHQQGVVPCFREVFRCYGLPKAIRSDNGSPFASTGLGGLTRLAVWWVRLGITVERIAPGRPDQNGRHERMHRTLKEAVPPQRNASAQQRAFDHFRQEFNEVRPHKALGRRTPSDHYQPSDRPYPERLPEIEYDEGWTVRRVRTNGQIRWKGNLIFASEALRGELIGLTPSGHDCWDLYYGNQKLGILDERLGRIIRPSA